MKTFILTSIFVILFISSQAQLKLDFMVENYHEVNTNYSELSLLPFGNDEILVSDRGIMDKKGRWGGNAPFNLYLRNANGETELMSSKLNSSYNDGPVTVYDKTLMYVTTTNRTGQIDPKTRQMVYRLNISKAEYKDGKWQVNEVPELSDKRYSYAHPSLSADGKTLYFVSDRPGGFGATDIYKCMIGDGSISEPENMGPAINTQFEEQFPFIHDSGYLFFSSRRKGGKGGLDIYYSKKLSYHELSDAELMGGDINTQAHESSIYFNKDMSAGYFTSNRMGGHGSDDIYLLKANNRIVEDAVVIKETIEQKPPIFEKEVAIKEEVSQLEIEKTPTIEKEIIQSKVIEKEIKEDAKEEPTRSIKEILETKMPNANMVKAMSAKEVEPKDEELLDDEPIAKIEAPVEVIKEKVIEIDKKEVEAIVQIEEVKVVEVVEQIIEKELPKAEPIKIAEPTVYTILEKKIVDRNLNNAYFNSNSSDLSSEAKAIIQELSQILKEDESAIIELHAHTDAKGDFESNAQLSEQRARAVIKALEMEGISPNRIRYLAYGESSLAINTKEEARMNRRVEFKIVDPNSNKGNVDPALHNSIRTNNVLEKDKFYVQVAAINKSKTINRFNLRSFGVPTTYLDKGMYKYVLGPYNTFNEANEKLKELAVHYPGVFIYLNVTE